MYRILIKRFFDFLFSFVFLVIFSPLFLILTIVLLVLNNGDPFFFQKRPGLNGKLFKLWKFKTMNDKCDANGNLLPDNQRITKFGLFVRKSSLDEIPQLINVLIGDMSIIGPRPLLPQYLPLYSNFQMRRHEVKPGITGWAQVNGRNAISWTKKFELDVWYVDNINLKLDVIILFKTIKKVFSQSGINQTDTSTMEAFKGDGFE